MTRTLTGATATIRCDVTGSKFHRVYISFGEAPDYDGLPDSFDEGSDSFGVHDSRIFFYCGGETELKHLMTEDKRNGFTVLDYELEYNEVTV